MKRPADFVSLLVGTIAVLTLLCAWSAHRYVVMPGYLELERQRAFEDISRVSNCVEDELDKLSRVAGDYATWDEMYDFVWSGSREFVKANLEMDYLRKMFGLSAIEVLDSRARSVWRGGAPTEDTQAGLSLKALAAEASEALLSRALASEEGLRGLALQGTEIYLVSIKRITRPSSAFEPNGALVLAKKISPEFLEEMGKRIQVKFAIRLHGRMPASAGPALKEVDTSTLLVSQGATDILARPIFTLETEVSRDILRRGRRASALVTAGIFVVGALLIGVTLVGGKVLVALDSRMEKLRGAIADKEKELAERKKVEAALGAALATHEQVQEIAHIGSWEYDLARNAYVGSNETKRLFGVDQELKELSANEVMRCWIESEKAHLALQQLIETDRPLDYLLEMVPVNSAEKRTLRVISNNVVRDAGGSPQKVLGVVHDVTEYVRAEEVTKESHQRLLTVLDGLDAVVYVSDMKTYELLFVNQYGKDIFGEIVGQPCWKALQGSLSGPCDFCTNDKLIDAAGNSTGPYGWEFQNTANGRWYDLRDRAMPWVDGRIVRIEIAADITIRKQAEMVLQASELRLRAAQRIAHMGNWELDLLNNSLTWSEEIYRIFEIDAKRFGASYDAFLAAIHPDDRDAVNRAYTQSLQTHQPYGITHRLLMPDGHIKYVQEQCETYYTPEGKPLRSVGTVQDVTEHVQAEETVKASEAKYRALVESTGTGYLILNQEGLVLDANAEYVRLTGHRELGDILGRTVIEWTADHEKQRSEAAVTQCVKDGFIRNLVIDYVDGSGRITPVEINANVVGEGEALNIILLCRDITERKHAEEERASLESQLQQAQKMESVGRLAGGVAHDFNNMLTVILGHAYMGLMRLEPTHPVCSNLNEISKAAERSANLTRQLLAFARKQTIAPRVLDLNDAVSGMLKMLQRLIGEDINLNWHPAPNLWEVELDPSQIDQILANLCVNARDAIANVGQITIETGNSTIDEEYCVRNTGFAVGEYVRLIVSDNGCGMNKETMAQIFEPFFTTKGPGEGTGLGLATVYGIVKQNEGFIKVYSEPGSGTTFTVYLPRYVGKNEKAMLGEIQEPAKRSRETILLVEDETAILDVTTLILEDEGYTVLPTNSPGEAIRLAGKYGKAIHLLMTDVVMPEMNGRDLAKTLQSLNPQLKCLYVSGYTADVIAHHGVLDTGLHFIQKPYSLNALTGKLREVLDSE